MSEGKSITIKKDTLWKGLALVFAALFLITIFGGWSGLEINDDDGNDLGGAVQEVQVQIENNDPVYGDANAEVSVVEFSDFQCPFCARFHIQTLPIIMDEYINEGKVKLVFRDFPIQSIHPNAVPASVAAECANEQEKFKEMHDILFERQNEWNNQETSGAMELFNQYAREMELKQEQFESCLTSAKYVEEIKKDLNDGRTYGITGTPGFFIGNDEIGFVELKGAQPFESFKKVIDNQLKN